jgi:colanic acid biosynthesis protein WcaH
MTRQKLSESEFARLIRVAPLVAIDAILRDSDNKVLLMLRNDEPARNCYFVPDGRILKDETISVAFERIVKSETGCDASFDSARLIGAYDHFYSTNRFQQEGYGTHYVVLAYEVALNGGARIELDAHQAAYEWLDETELKNRPDVHPHVKAYFRG